VLLHRWSGSRSRCQHTGLILEDLLYLGSEVDRKDCRGLTPLYLATLDGRKDLVVRLLEAGADPDPEASAGSAKDVAIVLAD
jgi:ankyrin repeat protein